MKGPAWGRPPPPLPPRVFSVGASGTAHGTCSPARGSSHQRKPALTGQASHSATCQRSSPRRHPGLWDPDRLSSHGPHAGDTGTLRTLWAGGSHGPTCPGEMPALGGSTADPMLQEPGKAAAGESQRRPSGFILCRKRLSLGRLRLACSRALFKTAHLPVVHEQPGGWAGTLGTGLRRCGRFAATHTATPPPSLTGSASHGCRDHLKPRRDPGRLPPPIAHWLARPFSNSSPPKRPRAFKKKQHVFQALGAVVAAGPAAGRGLGPGLRTCAGERPQGGCQVLQDPWRHFVVVHVYGWKLLTPSKRSICNKGRQVR